MKCPVCGYDMGKAAKCLRCGYTVTAIIPVDPEKIEQEEPQKTKVISEDRVTVSRASDGGIFGSLFGGGIGDIFDSIFGGGLFGGMGIFEDEEEDGYTYDPKYYDDFGNEIELPDEFERDSVEVTQVETLEPDQKKSSAPKHKKPSDHKSPKPSAHKRRPKK